ncbi:MAG: cell division protein ZapD [Burkholderiaceae bacterium]|nr:cell division protein ZapD [Burkholderiaceae bacterium]
MILYEYPFNERIRAYLRLEYLFDRLFFFAEKDDLRHHQIAVTTLFDILDALERTDVKTSVLQDVERQRTQLAALRGHPNVAQAALEDMLSDMERAASSLAAGGKSGQALRDNEWLVSLRGRVTVPGGASQVDMPSYNAWQHKPQEVRQADLAQWSQPLRPLFDGVQIAMRLLRESGSRQNMVASQGSYQQMLAGKVYQLMRVWVDPAADVFPEISGNKHMIWIRFSRQDAVAKPQQTGVDTPFVMSLCNA